MKLEVRYSNHFDDVKLDLGLAGVGDAVEQKNVAGGLAVKHFGNEFERRRLVA